MTRISQAGMLCFAHFIFYELKLKKNVKNIQIFYLFLRLNKKNFINSESESKVHPRRFYYS